MENLPLPRPTDGDLSILRVLWSDGASTVREIHDKLNGGTGYTTVLKLLQIMTDKGLVTRDVSARTHIYTAALAEEQTQRQLVSDLLDKAFGGSAEKLVMQALSSKKASREELQQIRKLLDQMEEK
ncbi:MAG: BlaI/MecI/CopY family transcriptional regulator [Verrucomicrobia bacterium]|nr:BlaI/MecI/CopY family transcriptional regulator [Verrucomicrobiota bacterium]